MEDLSVKKYLDKVKRNKFPSCEFGSMQCWKCAYFETDAPDGNGKCRCDYKGRWYYPHEGCPNGISREDYLKRQQEKQKKTIQTI